MRTSACIALLVCIAAAGCQSTGGPPKFKLAPESLAATQQIERLTPPGMPIEQARSILEEYGFSCVYQNTLGIEYLQCSQRKSAPLWPFRQVWNAMIYHQGGLVHGVQANYDLAVLEGGITIPPRGRNSPPSKSPSEPAMEPILEPALAKQPSHKAKLR